MIGDIKMLPEHARNELVEVMEDMKNNTGMSLIMALSYSSRWELVNAVKNIAIDVKLVKLILLQLPRIRCRLILPQAHSPTPN